MNPSRSAAVPPGRWAAAAGATMVPPATADEAMVPASAAGAAMVLATTALVMIAVTASLVLVWKLIWLAPGWLGQDAIA
jgi:hypothetical protein